MIDVARSSTPPASLARKKGYTEHDVLEALHRDFFGKCYLCERKLMIGEIQVEHRRPRSCWPEGTYCWTNLYPACAFCNGRRSRTYPAGGLLSPGEGVEWRIVQRARVDHTATTMECHFAAANADDVMAQATAEELERLHSGQEARTPRARYATDDLRDTIHDHYFEHVHPLERQVHRARRRCRPDLSAEGALAAVLSRRAPFTMLMRSLVLSALFDLFD